MLFGGLGSGAIHLPHSHNFFYILLFKLLLFTFINFFFLTFFNQWLRLKVAFCNYQSQPLIAIAPGAIP